MKTLRSILVGLSLFTMAPAVFADTKEAPRFEQQGPASKAEQRAPKHERGDNNGNAEGPRQHRRGGPRQGSDGEKGGEFKHARGASKHGGHAGKGECKGGHKGRGDAKKGGKGQRHQNAEGQFGQEGTSRS